VNPSPNPLPSMSERSRRTRGRHRASDGSGGTPGPKPGKMNLTPARGSVVSPPMNPNPNPFPMNTATSKTQLPAASGQPPQYCPECSGRVAPSGDLGRRNFIRAVAGGAVGMMGGSSLFSTPAIGAAPEETVRAAKPAEALVREFFATLTPEQKAAVVMPWDHGAEKGGTPTRLKTHNSAPLGKPLGQQFTKPQQELIRTTFKANYCPVRKPTSESPARGRGTMPADSRETALQSSATRRAGSRSPGSSPGITSRCAATATPSRTPHSADRCITAIPPMATARRTFTTTRPGRS